MAYAPPSKTPVGELNGAEGHKLRRGRQTVYARPVAVANSTHAVPCPQRRKCGWAWARQHGPGELRATCLISRPCQDAASTAHTDLV